MDGDVPRRAPYGVYILHLIGFASLQSCSGQFNSQTSPAGLSVYKLGKTCSKFYHRHYELISKFNVGLKTLLREGLSEPEFYGDLVNKFRKLIGRNDFSFQFGKIITRSVSAVVHSI